MPNDDDENPLAGVSADGSYICSESLPQPIRPSNERPGGIKDALLEDEKMKQARHNGECIRQTPTKVEGAKVTAHTVQAANKTKTTRGCVAKLPQPAIGKPFRLTFRGDARELDKLTDATKNGPIALPSESVDLIITSPPYWKKRDYGFKGQIGQESTPEAFVQNIILGMKAWKKVLRPSGSIFLNIGDTYWHKSLQGIPSLVEAAGRQAGWKVRNRIVWVKKSGMPDPAKDRLAGRHEYIIHFAMADYYYDLFGYAEKYSVDSRGANPGDVWDLNSELELGEHLAPFPTEIARRAIMLACPTEVCSMCGNPRRRIIERTHELDLSRPQARRAIELAKQHSLTLAHFAAIRATGISDAGKARHVQTGTDRNTKKVQRLAAEAKSALGGYFREFTFAKKRSVGWSKCKCNAPFQPGVVLDPFMGTGTTLDVANELGRSAIGIDLSPSTLKHL